MENYLLWSPSYSPTERTLSFFATEVNIQRISRGTREMVEQMLKDLGIEAAFENWTVRRFLTNYLTNDPDSEDWRNSWAETWEFRLRLTRALAHHRNRFELGHSREHDHTWDGSRDIFPVECVVVADFPAADKADAALNFLQEVAKAEKNPALFDQLKTHLSEDGRAIVDEIRRQLAERGSNASISAMKRDGYPRQIHVSLGVVERSFFDAGAGLASAIADLCEFHDGTTTWDDAFDIGTYR